MLCCIEGCEKPVKVKERGWCSAHYERFRRHGDPHIVRLGGARRKRYCKRGHDTEVVGRVPGGGCCECNRVYQREYQRRYYLKHRTRTRTGVPNLAALREEHSLTIPELARAAGLSRPTIWRIENVPGHTAQLATVEALITCFARLMREKREEEAYASSLDY